VSRRRQGRALGAHRPEVLDHQRRRGGIFIVFANTDFAKGYKGITAFLVERDFPGFSVGKKENKLGIRASSTTELILEQCQVPKANVLGPVGQGYKIAIETLNEGRIGIGAQMIGVGSGALAAATQYVKERKQFGKAIAEFQGIQFQLAQMATDLEAARLMVYNAARLKDAGQPFVQEAAMAKLFSSQVADRVSSQCLELFGGYGYSREYPAEKFLPRREDRDHLRGDQQHAAADDREDAAQVGRSRNDDGPRRSGARRRSSILGVYIAFLAGGRSTLSITWITPFEAATSAETTFALSAPTCTMLPARWSFRSEPSTVFTVT